MSSDEKSDSESKSERSRGRSEESEEESKSKANSSEVEESQANNSNSESEDKEKKKSNMKFESAKLVLSNEIKIEVTANSNDIFMTGINSVNNTENKKNSLKIINEINSNLDQLFDDLSITIKSFNINHTRRESYIYDNYSPRKNKPSNSPVNKHYISNEEEYEKDTQEQQESKRKVLSNIRKYTEKGISARQNSNKVRHTDKGTSTYEYTTKSFGNNPNLSLNKNEAKIQHNVQSSGNVYNNIKYNATNPYTNKSNHIRSIEDLYNHRKSEPIIYSNTARPIPKAVGKKFQNESDAYNSGRFI